MAVRALVRAHVKVLPDMHDKCSAALELMSAPVDGAGVVVVHLLAADLLRIELVVGALGEGVQAAVDAAHALSWALGVAPRGRLVLMRLVQVPSRRVALLAALVVLYGRRARLLLRSDLGLPADHDFAAVLFVTVMVILVY